MSTSHAMDTVRSSLEQLSARSVGGSAVPRSKQREP